MYISFSDRRVKRSMPDSPAGPGSPTTKVSSVVIALGIVSMLTDVSSESVAAILPLYITSVIGLSTVSYGFIDGLYQGISAFVRIAGGWAADRGDQPKWIAFFGYGVSALARVGFLFASGFGSLVGVLAIDRLGKGVRTAPRDALITASSAPGNLGHSFGVHRMLDTVGAAVGPLLAFVILFFIPDGYSTIFVVSLAFAILGVAILGLLVPNTRPRADRAATAAGEGPGMVPKAGHGPTRFRWRQLADPRLRRLLLSAGLLGILTIGDGFIYLVLQSRGAFAAAWFPLLYVGTNVVFLLLAIPFGRLGDRFGRGRIFIIGHLALLATYVCAALPVTGAPVAILCLALLGTFYAATDGILAALAAQCTPTEARASGIAAAQTVVSLTRLVASTGFGFLWFTLGREGALIVAAAALVVVIPVVAVLLRGVTSREAVP
jgi:MFS family permease